MEYFLLTCGEHTTPLCAAKLAKLVPKKLLTKQQVRELEDMSVIRIAYPAGERYADLISSPVYLMSNGIKELFTKYDKSLVCKAVRLVDEDSEQQLLYWIMGLDEVDCLSKETEFYPTGTLKRLVLSQEKIGKNAIFKLGGIRENHLVVRLDAAESLLRREFYGIELKKINMAETKEVIGDGNLRV